MTWPVEKQQYGSYGYLLREVGRALGYGGNADAWSRERVEIADACVQRGVRRFYNPPPVGQKKYSHDWSFLRPLRPLATEADKYIYDLPPDFSSLDGPITFTPDQQVLYDPIDVIPIHQMNQLHQTSTSTGRPTKAALVAKDQPGLYELHFYLTPDGAYTVQYPCRLRPLDLSYDNPMPFGGAEHSLTILAACLVEAEIENGVKESKHEPRFLTQLAASVSRDQKDSSPQTVGLNVDRSDRAIDPVSAHDQDVNIVTYNGLEY